MTCIIGGSAPSGNPNPCETITEDILQAWKIDEGTEGFAYGYVAGSPVPALDLVPWDFGNPEPWWNADGDDDDGRLFFGGFGACALPAGLDLLKYVGDGITIAQRRWFTGTGHVRSPLPFTSTGFGTLVYDYLTLTGGGPPVPRVWVRPTINTSGGGPGPYPVNPGSFYRGGYPLHTAIPGSQAVGCPDKYPPVEEPVPYMVVVTVVATAADRVTISVFGHNGTTSVKSLCFNTNADGSAVHSDGGTVPTAPGHIDGTKGGVSTSAEKLARVFGSPPASFTGGVDLDAGAPVRTIYGDFTELVIGGGVCYDTVHQAAIWKRALSPTEVDWLGSNLDKLFASIDEPGSECGGGGGCGEVAGPGTAHPLLKADGTTAIHPDFPATRLDRTGVIASEGEELRESRSSDEYTPRTYELVWNLAPGDEVELVRQAIEVTRGGSTWTRWRHPIDDPAGGSICSVPRWRILNAAEASGMMATRGRGGHVAGLRLVLEEFPIS